MDSGELSLFWDFLIQSLLALSCLLTLCWFDRGHVDELETSSTHDTEQPDQEPLLSSNSPEVALCFCAYPSLQDCQKTPHSGRRLSHRLKRARLSDYRLYDRYLEAGYCECRKETFVNQEGHPGKRSSSGGVFGHEPDLEAIQDAAEDPYNVFGSLVSLSAPAWLSNSIENYPWEVDDVLKLVSRKFLSCPDVRVLLRETDERLRPIWNSNPRTMLPELMVIDCFSRRVVAAQPGCNYVALSYVWGSKRSRNVGIFQRDLRGRRLPQTVQDAMNVVRVLGMQFLWVDQYCINSTEPVTKHYMISNMDAIYEAAYLTIIAASGSDDEHGLPSVSKSSKAGGGGHVPPWDGIVCTIRRSRCDQIKQSAWSTRGWTYQEGLLSRRRLIFIDGQVILHYRGNYPVKANSGIFLRINEYSKRSLTYPSDLLNAFLGVLRAYERLRSPAMHIWGVPFLLDSDGNIRQPGYGLLWRAGLGYSLSHIRGLPSWTWAGWNGWAAHDAAERVPYDEWDDGYLQRLSPPGPYRQLLEISNMRLETWPWAPSDISLEVLAGEHLVDISDHFRQSRRLPFGLSAGPAPILYLTAWSVTVTGYILPRFSVYLEGGDMGTALVTFDPTVESLCKPESQVGRCWNSEWTAVVICWKGSNERVRGLQTQSLLLERVGEDTFLRVGILETDWQKSDMDEDGHMVALGRTFTRARLRIV